MPQLDDQLLEEFVFGFYGHGNLQGDYWFVGMEHGGGTTFESIKKRIDRWSALGQDAVTDLFDYGRGIGEAHYFEKPIKNQPTWNKLIRLLLSLKGDEQVTLAKVKAYQATQWGRHDGETAVLELFPLPSPSANHWLYSDLSQLPYLTSRKSYRAHLLPIRIKHLQEMITTHRPRLVHFYGGGYGKWWRQVTSVSFEKGAVNGRNFHHGYNGTTHFLITQHPVARGVTINYFHKIGSFLRGLLGKNGQKKRR